MIIKSRAETIPMKVINLSTPAGYKAYSGRPPEDTHSKEELEALHRAIRFTHEHKMNESMTKMDEESPINLPIPLSMQYRKKK